VIEIGIIQITKLVVIEEEGLIRIGMVEEEIDLVLVSSTIDLHMTVHVSIVEAVEMSEVFFTIVVEVEMMEITMTLIMGTK